MSSFFNRKQIEAMNSGIYICPECGERLKLEDDNEDTLVCEQCGYSVAGDDYGATEEEVANRYPSKIDICENDSLSG